jgi:DNA polymerase III delta subunit
VGDSKSIGSGDVGELVGFHREEKIFGMIDAAERRDLAGAMNLWQQVLATDRAAPFRAVGGLAWALRRLIEQRGMQHGGGRGRFNATVLQRQLARLADVDQAAKTGRSTVESAVERFIVELCNS